MKVTCRCAQAEERTWRPASPDLDAAAAIMGVQNYRNSGADSPRKSDLRRCTPGRFNSRATAAQSGST
jgi:hypothetical protein